MKLWYDREASKWHEALPFGNGRLGGMVFGGVRQERIQLNEDSVWSGRPLDRNNPAALENLPKLRKLVREGKIREAEQLALYAFSGTPNSQRAYQTAGELYLNLHGIGEIVDYKRELDLETGVLRTEYKTEKTTYKRELFSSYPDGVIVMRLTAEGENSLNFDLHLERQRNFTNEVDTTSLDAVGFLADTGDGGIFFAAHCRVSIDGGQQEKIGEHLIVKDAKEALLCLDIETSFREENYREICERRVQKAFAKGWDALKADHQKDYQALFGRVFLRLGDEDDPSRKTFEQLPVDARMRMLRKGKEEGKNRILEDVGLVELYFQYGRYLLIACSREGSLPATLQGLWNHSMQPAWDSKYTININTEMNYWLAGPGNLPECELPLFDLLERMKENGKKTARVMYGCRGSVAHHNTDLYADTAPQDYYIPATFWVFGEVFLATHIWNHYCYTQDVDFLRKHFDILEQCVLFFEDFLTEQPDGKLSPCPSVSPENTYILPNGERGCMCEGSMMDIELLQELLEGYLSACRILGETQEKTVTAEEILKRLPRPKIGRFGQLQEWQEDYEEAEPGHRHVSHLFGIYPGTSLTWEETPQLMEAAIRTLERRLSFGGGYTGWSRAWITLLWARLRNGENAGENLRALLSDSTFDNLMDNHPYDINEDGKVFQIDGNLGGATAIVEMIVQQEKNIQERKNVVTLLPALPDWMQSGCVRGIRLKGGILLDLEWKNGEVTEAVLKTDTPQELKLWINGESKMIFLEKGNRLLAPV